MPSTSSVRLWMLLAALVSLSARAQRGVHECRDAQGRLVFQDQPCRGDLHRADEPPPVQRWLTEELAPCQLRSPLIEVPLLPLPASDPEAQESAPPWSVGLWLELFGSRDGVALRIRGFDPLPDAGIAFDTHITGQGIRAPAGQLIEVDALDGPGSLRYGYRGSAILLDALSGGGEARLEIRIRGFQAVPTAFDLTAVNEAVERLENCRERERPQRSGQRRRPRESD